MMGYPHKLLLKERDKKYNPVGKLKLIPDSFNDYACFTKYVLFFLSYRLIFSDMNRYKDLSEVERAFRDCKTVNLEVHPVYVRKEESTRGRLPTCNAQAGTHGV